MDQTQLLDWDTETDPEDPSDSGENPTPVGRLHLLSSKYGPEKDFWIYPGKNVIGRLENCQICLPASSVSKAHAVIEVPSPDGPHLLYDQKSMNGTRRQRMVLIPHVRYSLQDGDTLLFGDVGCQYFLLVPEGAPESPNDSWEVPPTQTSTDANALVIEETPAPGRKMRFRGLLVQDSGREEEDEEVVNGVGKILHLPRDDGSGSLIKPGARGHCSLASSMFFSPSATVVPESDDESGEPSESGPPCPSLRLRHDSDEAEPRSLVNGAVTPVNQERHLLQPGNAEVKTLPDCGGQPVVKDQDASTHPSVTDFHLDSDTDMEDEDGVGTASERPTVKDDLALELGSDTDADEPLVVDPDVGSSDNRQLANAVDSDTDIEEAEEKPGIMGLKAHQVTESGDSDTDAEGAIGNPGAASPESREPRLQRKDSCKGEEKADGDAEGHRPHEEADSDTDVEAVEDPDVGLKIQPPTENEDGDTDVEEPPLGVENREGTLKGHEASRDCDTGVEGAESEADKLGGAHPHSPLPVRNKDCDADVEEIKGIRLQGNSDMAERAKEVKNTSGEADGEQSAGSDRMEPTVNPEAAEELTSVPANQHPLTLSVESDTDAEEAAENPRESSKQNHEAASNGPSGGNGGSRFVNQGVGSREDGDSDTDVEATPPSPKTHDSDTDAEEATAASPGKPLEEQATQLVPVRPTVHGDETASSGTELKLCRDPSKEDEDTDAEGNESQPGDESNTDNEDDSDLAIQATQCYLPTVTSSPKVEKARDTAAADSRRALEEEATQAFVFRAPLGLAKFQPGKTCSSPVKDDDPDIYMLEATQPFCKGPATLAEEPTQAFITEQEEDTELFVQCPLEGEDFSKQATQPFVPISSSSGQQDSSVPRDTTQPHSIEVSCPEPSSQPAGGTAAEELHKEDEIQTVRSVQVSPSVSGQPLAPPEVEKASRSKEQACAAFPEAEVAAELSQPQGGAGRIEGGPERRHSELAAGARDAEQLPEHATEQPSKPVAFVSERRRSLRSSAVPSPSPLPERRSSRLRGQVGSADTNSSSEPVAPLARFRGRQQLRGPTQDMKKEEEPRAEEASLRKTPSKGESAVTAWQGRLRRTQQGSQSATKPEKELAAAASSPATKEPVRARKRRAPTAEPVEDDQQPERRQTRSSRQSGGTSVMTPSPKDSGKRTKVGQEPAQSTPSSGKRSQHPSTERKPVATTRNRSHSSAASAIPAPKVLFTGVIDEEGEHVVTELGGSLAGSVFDCTHLVTDRVRRTVKFLCALARGVPIVTLDWLEKSRRNSFFLAPSSFLVRDPEQEKTFQFSLAASLQKARQKGGLLQGYELHVTPSVKPEPEHMRDIIKCSGGTFLPRMPRAYKDKRVVISCTEDLPRCKPAQDAGVPIANSEFILTGILQQKADLDAHRLDGVGASSLDSPTASITRASKRRAVAPTAPAPPNTAKRRR
ncbi:mediator of DNA damage checkpoint protein 1 isoform X2 [Eublepharis macularius]|nr:mediator of DNA damage checkpoint protein 1 isoform X2 [Eublepharis macularius]XP_054833188.1 mediator of DNA damage checkpoint protein 1 isoform X2 [Eublepharis macularius]